MLIGFDKNVFINCPFDDAYQPLRDVILFTIRFVGGNPLISQTFDASVSRLESIIAMIGNSEISIHDLSRIQFNKDELPRFNMPFELGLDFGAKHYHPELRNKSFCILVGESYTYQAYLSDLAGRDPAVHNNDEQTLCFRVAAFLHSLGQFDKAPLNYNIIWQSYNRFQEELKEMVENDVLHEKVVAELTPSNYITLIDNFLAVA